MNLLFVNECVRIGQGVAIKISINCGFDLGHRGRNALCLCLINELSFSGKDSQSFLPLLGICSALY